MCVFTLAWKSWKQKGGLYDFVLWNSDHTPSSYSLRRGVLLGGMKCLAQRNKDLLFVSSFSSQPTSAQRHSNGLLLLLQNLHRFLKLCISLLICLCFFPVLVAYLHFHIWLDSFFVDICTIWCVVFCYGKFNSGTVW